MESGSCTCKIAAEYKTFSKEILHILNVQIFIPKIMTLRSVIQEPIMTVIFEVLIESFNGNRTSSQLCSLPEFG